MRIEPTPGLLHAPLSPGVCCLLLPLALSNDPPTHSPEDSKLFKRKTIHC